MLNAIARPIPGNQFIVAHEFSGMTAGLGANSSIMAFRWAPAPNATAKLAVLLGVTLEGMLQLTGFTAGSGAFRLTKARGFTAPDTGGTSLVPATLEQKARSTFADSALGAGNFVGSTAGALTPGTRTLEAKDFAFLKKFIPAAANSQVFDQVPLYQPRLDQGEHPQVFDANEGFVMRAVVPATGTWEMVARVHWAEVNRWPV